ncbi:hypothetical protein AGMMS50267_03520 [Spirochaetia bacterium]|nr:hypothetical protein AGMMS50267_03520 [Spirochaetia bacterium]
MGRPLEVNFFPVLFCALCVFINIGAAGAQELPAGSIPLLISDHHADHATFLLRRLAFETKSAAMILVDAHPDTALNKNRERIFLAFAAGEFMGPDTPEGDALFQNHNWIDPLFMPSLFGSLVWINRLADTPDSGKMRGFLSSTAGWGSSDYPKFTRAITLNRLRDFEFPGDSDRTWDSRGRGMLVISIDLDFFYLDNYTQEDIPFVFDTLFEYSSRWNGDVIWAVCLSRAWLPSDDYAWELLRQSLRWFSGKPAFAPPALTLFTKNRKGGSMKERAFNEMGREAPTFFGKENEMPEDIRKLFGALRTVRK